MRYTVVFFLLLLLGACGPEPTPFPVDAELTPVSTTLSVTPVEGGQTPLPVYALAPETAGLIPDLPLITAQVISLQTPVNPADLGNLYHIVVTYGTFPDWTPSPLTPQVALMINTAALPDASLASIIRRALRPQEIADSLAFPGMTASTFETASPGTLRTELANSGLPDGVELTLADTSIPGADMLISQLRESGLFARKLSMTTADARTALDTGRVQLALIMWAENAQAGTENVLPLYTLPISYQVVEGREVTFTPSGFPLIK